MLEETGDLKTNYWDYMTTEPINCNEELKRLESADYDLCSALLTMLLREDHFCNGAFDQRVESGQVERIVQRMIKLLENKERFIYSIYLQQDSVIRKIRRNHNYKSDKLSDKFE